MAERGPDLRAFQQRFLDLVTAREDVAGALAARGMGEAGATAIATGDHRAGAVERLDVYANMYFLRLRDVLADDFPKLRSVVGEASWEALAMDYLQAHPPSTPAIRDVGAALPAWLCAREARRPDRWWGDLAALEWARADVFDRVDEPLMTLDDLLALPAEAFVELPLRLVAAHELVEAETAVDEVWRRVQRGEDPGEPASHAQTLLVWRQGADVRHRALDHDEAIAIAHVRGGTTFGSLCEELAQTRDEEAAARRAAELVQTWLAAELMVALG